MDVKSYIKAARLRTLPLSISGIILGSYLGNEFVYSLLEDTIRTSIWESSIFWLAIFTTIGFQVLGTKTKEASFNCSFSMEYRNSS